MISALVCFSLTCLLQICSGQQASIGTFWHFTDFHVDTKYDIENTSELWGSYDRDTSTIVAFTAIELGNDRSYAENKPDFVIWGGDAAPHGDSVSEADLLDSLKFLSMHFKRAFATDLVPIIPLIGNHDVYPANNMSPNNDDPKRIAWCTSLAFKDTLWSPWIASDDDTVVDVPGLTPSDFAIGCFQSLLLHRGKPLLILGINSLVWYSNNPLVDESIDDPLGQFKWLTQNLQWVRKKNGSAILAMHVPIGAPEFDPTNYKHLKEKYNDKMVAIIRDYSDIIMTVLGSHEHVDAFRIILDEKSNPVTTMFLGPAVTPIHLEKTGSNNPRIRQYFYNRTSGRILDYKQFMLNLEEPEPSWVLEYQATVEYKLTSLQPKEMASLLDRFTEKDNENGLWDLYWKHQLGGRPHDPIVGRDDNTCPEARSVCRCQQICSIRHLDSSHLNECLKICSSSSKPKLPTIDELIHPDHHSGPSTGTIVGIVIGVLLVLGLVGAIGFLIYRKRRRQAY